MKVLLIPDKFKGSLTAVEVIASIKRGLLKVSPQCFIQAIQASDGGDGFLDAVSANIKCDVVQVETVDSHGNEINVEYLHNSENNTAYIELAKASGLTRIKEKERNIMLSSTYGTGLQIKSAIEKGCTSIYLGLGGSATNDAGLGIAQALGFYFLDGDGNQLEPNGSNLSKVKSIHKKTNALSLKGISFFAVNDVDNPLFGKNGAAHIYARQKGANDKQILALDCGLKDLADVIQAQTKKDAAHLAGSGAAGGTAYGLKVFCDAEYISGVEFVLGISKVEELLSEIDFDYIITGEGKFDSQTLNGKLIKGVLDLGKRFNVPVIALCGELDLDKMLLKKYNNLRVLEIKDVSKTLDYNMKNAGSLIEKSVELFLVK